MRFNTQTLNVSKLKNKINGKIFRELWYMYLKLRIYLVTFIVTVLFILIIEHYVCFFNLLEVSNSNSARYLLSSLIQSQVAMLAIVITISLIAVQLASSSYSPRVIGIFMRNADFYILLIVYVGSIYFISGILKIIPESNTIFQNQTSLSNVINIALLIYFITLTMLVPYFYRVLNLLKPSNIIEELAKDITMNNISNSAQKDKKIKNEANPLVPILDVIRSSCLKHDIETTRKGLKEIEQIGEDILKSDPSVSEVENLISLFTKELESFGEFAINLKDDNSSKETVITLQSLNKILVEVKFHQFIEYVNISLKNIGVAAVEKYLIKTAEEAIESIYEIEKEVINVKPEIYNKSILFLGDLARNAIKYKVEGPTNTAIQNIRLLGIVGLKEGNEGREKTAMIASWSLELIGKTKGIHELILKTEDWEESTQTFEVEGEVYDDTIVIGGVEYKIYLFEETVRAVFYIGIASIKAELYSASKNAILNLERIGENAIRNKFDVENVPILLGHIGIKALKVKNEELAKASIKALVAISKAANEDFRNTLFQTADSLIRVGTVALETDFKEIASYASKTLVDLESDKISTSTINHIFNSSSLDIEKFKKLYISEKEDNKSNNYLVLY